MAAMQIGTPAGGGKPPRRLGAEIGDFGLDPLALRDLGDVGGRLDAQHVDVTRLEVLQQIAVIAGHLDDERGVVEPILPDHFLGVVSAVAEPQIRVGREIEVVVENALRRLELLELDQKAGVADISVKRVESLALPEIIGGEE